MQHLRCNQQNTSNVPTHSLQKDLLKSLKYCASNEFPMISAGCQQKNGFDPKILCWGRWCHRLSRETAGGRCEDLHCENATRLQKAFSQAWKYKPQSVPLVWMSCHVLCSAIVLPTEPLVGLVGPWQSSTLAWHVDPASPSCKSNRLGQVAKEPRNPHRHAVERC